MYLHDRSTIFKCFVHVQHHCSRRQREFSVNLKARIHTGNTGTKYKYWTRDFKKISKHIESPR